MGETKVSSSLMRSASQWATRNRQLEATPGAAIGLARQARGAELLLAQNLMMFAVVSFLYLSGSTLEILGWDYAGGSSALQNFHPGTYLLIATFGAVCLLSPDYFSRIISIVLNDVGIWSFTLAAAATAAYAIVVRHSSIAPFVETFADTILSFLVFLTLPSRLLHRFRTLVDIFMLLNIGIIAAEYFLHRRLVPVYIYGFGFNLPFDRPAGLFGHPLSATGSLCGYAVANVLRQISLPSKNNNRAVIAFVALLAAVLTGGRTSTLTTAVVLAALFLFISARTLATGISRKSERRLLLIWICAGLLAIPLAIHFGVFDLLLGRLNNDNGSAFSRGYAIQILENTPMQYWWLGSPASLSLTQQQIYGITAIEISWINFILVCGLVFTIPLFVGYCLFLFTSWPRYISFAYAPAIIVFISQASTIGLWGKSTGFAVGVAILLAFAGPRSDHFPRRRERSYRSGSISEVRGARAS